MKILDEKLLASDFTFGFELEAYLYYKYNKEIPLLMNSVYDEFIEDAIATSGQSYDWIVDNIKTVGDYLEFKDEYSYGSEFDELISDDLLYKKAAEVLDIKKYFPDGSKWIKKESSGFTYDGSLSLAGFEWRSPVMVFTPESIAHCIAFLKRVRKVCYIGEDCGFHTHISFNGISEDDAKWIMIKLSQDPDMIRKMQNLSTLSDRNKSYSDKEREPLSFYSHWADTNYLLDISEALHEDDFKELNKLLSTEKYRALRIHPQGTLEWRSPRDFFSEDYSEEYIKSFFLSLYDFITWMRNTLESDSVAGYDKKNLLDMINGYKNDNLFYKDNSILHKKFDKIITALEANPDNIYKFEKLPLKHCSMFMDYFLSKNKYNEIDECLLTLATRNKRIPNNFLAAFICVRGWGYKLIGNVIKHLSQPLPVKEIDKVSKNNFEKPINILFRFFQYLSKDDIINLIHNTSSPYEDFCSLLGIYKQLVEQVFGTTYPAWFYNAILERYNKKPVENN